MDRARRLLPYPGVTVDESARNHINDIMGGRETIREQDTPKEQVSVEPYLKSLQKENAELWYENMMLDGKITSETAKLWYAVMMGGNTI